MMLAGIRSDIGSFILRVESVSGRLAVCDDHSCESICLGKSPRWSL
jgi:hypothetical protein